MSAAAIRRRWPEYRIVGDAVHVAVGEGDEPICGAEAEGALVVEGEHAGDATCPECRRRVLGPKGLN